jgi:hypothetical protein
MAPASSAAEATGGARGASTFTDFAQGSDSEKNAIDPNYESAFLNTERTIAESDAMRYFRGCVEGASWSAVSGAFAGPGGAALGGATGCGTNVAEMGLLDVGAPESFVKTAKRIVETGSYVIDLKRGLPNVPDILKGRM